MHVLAISSAYGGCSACLTACGAVRAEVRTEEEHGLAASLPALIQDLLVRAGQGLDMVAVSVGPGSFTGLRAGLSVAVGIGLARGVPVIGVTVTEAFEAAALALDGRRLWVAIAARKGRVFIDMGGGAAGYPTDALPPAQGRIAIAGNAAAFVASALAARGDDVMLTDARLAHPRHVAAAAALKTGEPAWPPLPVYVDAPEARLPSGGLRAAPI
jgi:tRNA threonylcarbamoyl adenosine modification protein YeaZ